MTVGDMLSSMTSAELTEWQAYDEIEPIGEVRADIRAGQVCSTFVNVMAPSRDGKRITPADFLLFVDRGRTDNAPAFVDDPDAQSALIMSSVFGITPD